MDYFYTVSGSLSYIYVYRREGAGCVISLFGGVLGCYRSYVCFLPTITFSAIAENVMVDVGRVNYVSF